VKQRARSLAGGALALSLLLAGCSREKSPEEQVREVIVQAETATEARDLSDVTALVAETYTDTHGQDKAAIRDVMRGYFLINQSIHLLTRIDDVRFPADELASAHVSVGMLGQQAQEDWALAADVYEFDIQLRRIDGEWKLQNAEWRRPGG